MGIGLRCRLSNANESTSNKQYQTLSIDVPMRRKPGYYLWNIVLIQALISAISLSTSLIEVSDFAGRMENILTVLLSTVAFKFIIAEALPNINYETKLDWYLLYSFFLITLVVLQASIHTSVRIHSR